MRIMKKFFEYKSNEEVYKYEICRISLVLLLIITLCITAVIFIQSIIYRILITILIMILFYALILSVFRIINISDNKERLIKKTGEKKYNWKPIEISKLSLCDTLNKIEFSLNIDVLLNSSIIEIGVVYDIDLKSKKYYWNDYEIDNYQNFCDLLTKVGNDKIIVSALDNQNPNRLWPKIHHNIHG